MVIKFPVSQIHSHLFSASKYCYIEIVAGMIVNASSFNILGELNNQPFFCETGNSQKDSFQQCLANLKAKDAMEFAGKYVRFQVVVP